MPSRTRVGISYGCQVNYQKTEKSLGRLILVRHSGQLDFTDTLHISLYSTYGIAEGVVE